MHRHLVERAMAGDHDAFSELARVRIGRLYAIAVLILRDPGRAEDATQEALVAAWRDLSALRDPDRFDAWLRRLLVRACHREARRARSRPTIDVQVPSIEPSVPDASVAAGRSRRDRARVPPPRPRPARGRRPALLRRPAPPRGGRCPRHPRGDREVAAPPGDPRDCDRRSIRRARHDPDEGWSA